MHLSRLAINPRSREAQQDLADVYGMHRTVMSAFPQVDGLRDARAELGVLHRLELGERSGDVVLLVQSGVSPDWSHLARGYLAVSAGTMENPATKDVSKSLDALHDGQLLRFRLRANPTRKIETRSTPDGRRQNGRRVDLRTEELQLEWLYRRAGQSGFALYPTQPGGDVPAVRIGAGEKVSGRRRRISLATVLFDGLLEVTGSDAFRHAIATGIGPGKAFGCGLMSIAPHREYA